MSHHIIVFIRAPGTTLSTPFLLAPGGVLPHPEWFVFHSHLFVCPLLLGTANILVLYASTKVTVSSPIRQGKHSALLYSINTEMLKRWYHSYHW